MYITLNALKKNSQILITYIKYTYKTVAIFSPTPLAGRTIMNVATCVFSTLTKHKIAQLGDWVLLQLLSCTRLYVNKKLLFIKIWNFNN